MKAKDRQRWLISLALIALGLVALSRWLPAWRRLRRVRQLRQQARQLVQRVAAMGD